MMVFLALIFIQKGEKKMTLTEGEKNILWAYNDFYAEKYRPVKSNTDSHILAQKMVFLLGFITDKFTYNDFVWEKYGPFSDALQNELKQIDSNKNGVYAFYASGSNAVRGATEVNLSNTRIDLCIEDHIQKKDIVLWVEALGSLVYIAKYILPGESYNRINKELCVRKPKFKESPIPKEAWRVLRNQGLVS